MKTCRSCGEALPLDAFNRRQTEPDGRDRRCRECVNRRKRELYPRHAEKNRDVARKWREDNPERVRLLHQRWHQQNAESLKEYNRRYRLEHREALAERRQANQAHRQVAARWERANRSKRSEERKRIRRENPERERQVQRVRYVENPAVRAQAISQNALRRARLAGVPSEPIDLLEIARRDKFICHLCGVMVRRGELSLDHIVPISQGGAHIKANVALAHLKCNLRRGIKPLSCPCHSQSLAVK